MAITTSGTIDPNVFGAQYRARAERAAEQDQAHTARIKGTDNPDEIKASFKESQNTWKAEDKKDSYKASKGPQAFAPDGGMRQLAKSLGKLSFLSA